MIVRSLFLFNYDPPAKLSLCVHARTISMSLFVNCCWNKSTRLVPVYDY